MFSPPPPHNEVTISYCYELLQIWELGTIMECNKNNNKETLIKKGTCLQIGLSEYIYEVLTKPNLCLPPSPFQAKEQLLFVIIY